jgi:hypothetical protein
MSRNNIGATANLKSGPHIIAKTGSEFEPEYIAILDRAIELQYSLPSYKQQIAQNNYLLQLKNTGLWNAKVVIYVFLNDGSSEFATLNWKSPSNYQCLQNGGVLWQINHGFLGNSSNAFLNTQWRPITDGGGVYTQNSAHHCYMIINEDSGNGFGLSSDANSQMITLSASKPGIQGSIRINQGSGTALTFDGKSPAFYCGNRSASNAQQLYVNGEFYVSNAAVSTTIANINMHILNRNKPTTDDGYGDSFMACYSAGRSLSSNEMLTDYQEWIQYFSKFNKIVY